MFLVDRAFWKIFLEETKLDNCLGHTYLCKIVWIAIFAKNSFDVALLLWFYGLEADRRSLEN